MRPRRALVAGLCTSALLFAGGTATAVTDPTAGPFPQVHGELVPRLDRPADCTTELAQGATFANSAYGPGGAYSGTYTPSCTGPWSRVVVTMSADVTPGTQFDRIGELQVGGAELLHFTTPEGTFGTTTWSVQRDVTEDASLFAASQPVWFQIGNVTDSTYTGVFHGSVRLSFWDSDTKAPPAPHADLVVPLSPVPATARNLPYLTAPGQRLTTAVTLPHNLTALRAEVFTSGHGPCEEDWWYEPFTCSGQPFREVAVYVDGTLAGVAPVFPAVFTGGWGPDWWRPVPGPRTLDLRPYTVDLTPFVGQLTDDAPHSFAVGILGWTVPLDGDYWPTATNLLATVNHADTGRTEGGLLSATGPSQPAITLTGEPTTLGGRYAVTHEVVTSGWTRVPGGPSITDTVRDQVDASLLQVGPAVDSRWHWQVAATSTAAPPYRTDATYQLVRDGARFAFVDRSRTSDGASWQATDDRMQTSGPALVTGILGASRERWSYADSGGYCLTHRIVAGVQNVLVDQLSRTCPRR